MMLLVPYFVVLVLLAGYGVHRYVLVYLYYKNKKNAAHSSEPPGLWPEGGLPRVTVQLPIFNEQYVIERLVAAVCKFDYPADRLEIQVLDDSTDETVQVASEVVARYAAAGHNISYHHRTNRYGYKAGALDEGMKSSSGEFIAIFDADFVPPEDWLMKVIHHFTDPQVGMVQTRWTHLNRDYSFLTEVEAILLDGHFILEHGGRSRSNVFFNFNGTAGMWRRKAIEEAGGWEHDTLTEDTDLSYRSQLKGWKFKYLQDVECPAELPIEMTAFKTQQARWAKGLIQVGKKILPKVFRSDVPPHIKLEAWYHLTANLSYPLMVVLSTLLLPAMMIRFYQGWFQMMFIDLPLFLASTFSVSSFYLVSQKMNVRSQFFGAVPEELAADVHLPALPDGAGHWADGDQHQGGDGGAVRGAIVIQAHAEICGAEEGRSIQGGEEVSAAAGRGAVDRAGDRHIFRVHGVVRDIEPELHHHPLSDAFCVWVLGDGADVSIAGAVRPLLTAQYAGDT